MIIRCRRCKQPIVPYAALSEDGDIPYFWCDNCVDYVGVYNDLSGVEKPDHLASFMSLKSQV